MSIRRLKRMVNKPARPHFMIDLTALQEARRLIDRKDWIGAQHLLVELNQQSPNLEEILAPLALTHYHLNELPSYLMLCIQINKLLPNDAEHRLALAHAYLMNGRIVLAYIQFRQFLQRWPDHEEAARARERFDRIESRLGEVLAQLELSGEGALELAALHEEMQALLDAGKYKEGIAKAEELLRHRPDYTAAYNNLSLMQCGIGEIEKAIACAEHVLTLDPDNVHALGNLTHYLAALGREAEARRQADRLKRVEHAYIDHWIKQAEACATINDDQGVLDALHAAEKTERLEEVRTGFLAYHLAAVAQLRLGREDEARALWAKCLQLSPAYSVAQANLGDLTAPPHKRNGPWSFPIDYWISQRVVDDLSEEHRRAQKRREKDMGPAMKRFLSKHPHIPSLLPILFDRGDPGAREFAFTIASFLKTPDAIAMLREFGLGEKGTDVLRLKALSKALELAGGDLAVLPVRLKGRPERTRLRTVEIDYEPEHHLPPEAYRLYLEAYEALNERQDGVLAERLLKQALALAPESPQLLNNLAMAYTLQDRAKEADRLLRQIHEAHPNYLFARFNLANRLIGQRKYDEALELLNPIETWDRMHATEAAGVHNVWIHLHFAQGDREMAAQWLNELERVAPADSHIEQWHNRFAERERLPDVRSILSLLREQLGK